MNGDFRAQLEMLARRIQQDPRLELLSLNIGDPLEPDRIDEIQRQFGAPIPDSVRALYGSLNGATLRWRFTLTGEDTEPASYYEFCGENGIINILSLENMLLNDDYSLPQSGFEDAFDFDGAVYPDDQFCQMLRPFDILGEVHSMAFVTVPESVTWKLILLGDYWIEYDHSRTIHLDDYLRYIIATWGLAQSREELLSEYRGDQKEPLKYTRETAASATPPMLGLNDAG
jgi:hypothetical protein